MQEGEAKLLRDEIAKLYRIVEQQRQMIEQQRHR